MLVWLEDQEKVGTIVIATNGMIRVSEPIMELMENNPDIFVLPDAFGDLSLCNKYVDAVVDKHKEHVPELELSAGDIAGAHKIFIKVSGYGIKEG